jgi:hypothetical protein
LPTEPWCPERDSNPQTLGFKPRRSTSLAYLGTSVVPDGVEPSFPGCRPGVVGRWTTGPLQVESPGVAPEFPACHAGVFLLDHDPMRRKPWDSNPQAAPGRHLFSGQVPHPAGWLPLLCIKSCGGWNRTNIKTSRTSRPTVRRPRIDMSTETSFDLGKFGEEGSNLRRLVQGQEAYH